MWPIDALISVAVDDCEIVSGKSEKSLVVIWVLSGWVVSGWVLSEMPRDEVSAGKVDVVGQYSGAFIFYNIDLNFH